MTPRAWFNRRVWTVLRREYLQRVRNKWFLITTFGVPLLFAGLIALPAWLSTLSGDEASPLQVGVVDRTGTGVGDRVVQLLEGESTADLDTLAIGTGGRARSPRLRAEAVHLPDSESLAELGERLLISEVEAFLVLPAGTLEGRTTRLLTRQNVGFAREAAIRKAVRRAVLENRLQGTGLSGSSVESLLSITDLGVSVLRVGESGVRSQEAGQGIAFGLGVALYAMLLIYGQMVVRGVVEEKTSDIVEVLLSSLNPRELMLGKIVGIGAVGLTQVALWFAALVGLALWGLSAAAPALAEAGIDLGSLGIPLAETAAAFVVFFLLGYLLYSALFAGAGAMAGSEQDIQQVTMPITILVVGAVLLMMPMLEAPQAAWAVIVSQVPLFSPVLMVARVATGVAAPWEAPLALFFLAAGVVSAVWLAGRVYRVGILMTGKRATLPELWRWLRYS